jgi:NAD(P)-dependent dehydrogenase (short-subunit alcohol dehydrogenase family)
MMDKSSRRVVITGASGIAAATARQLAAEGDHCFIISRSEESCAEVTAELGDFGAGYFIADLQSEPETENAFEAAAKTLDGFDAVVAVAGGSARKFGDGWIHDMSLDAWNASLGLNLTTMFLTARESIRHMREHGGSLVMTSSVLATFPQPDNFTTHGYAAAKAAITGWTVPLAAAYASQNVRVNTVAPGLVHTPMAKRAAETPAIVEFAQRKQPLQHGLLTPELVADALCWFVRAEGVTGQVVAVDGGWSVTSTS